MADSLPPVPADKFSEQTSRDYMIKEYLQKIKTKLEELEARMASHGI